MLRKVFVGIVSAFAATALPKPIYAQAHLQTDSVNEAIHRRRPTFHDIVEISAVVALILAAIQFRDARHQTKALLQHTRQLEDQTRASNVQIQKLEKLEQSLSTRYLGPFPSYVPKIVEIISSATQEILILCDYPAYACFSNSAAFRRYKRVLEDKIADKVPVRIICYHPAQQTDFHWRQFPHTGDGWNHWKTEPGIRSKLEDLFQREGASAELADLSFDEITEDHFHSVMLATNAQMLKYTLHGASCRGTTELMPMYFWVADRQTAVFAIPSLSKNATEQGFYTTSPDFISAFADLWENRYAEKALPIISRIPPATDSRTRPPGR